MGQLEEHEGDVVVGDVARAGLGQHVDGQGRDLVGDHVADVQPDRASALRTAGWRQSGRNRRRTPARRSGGQQRDGHGDDAGRGARARARGGARSSSATWRQRVVAAQVERAHEQEHGDHHHVVEHRRPRRRREAAAGVEQRGAERHQPVEEDLRHEQQAERDADPAEVGRVDARSGVGAVEHDEQRGDDAARAAVSDGERDDRHRHDRRRALVVLVLELRREQRHEGGGQDAAEDQLVDDVRGVVGQVVGVAQRGPRRRRTSAREPGHAR